MAQNESPFEELLLPHLDGAYNLARWLVENDQDAQAIVREAYVQAMKQPAQVRETDARIWLLTIVRKTAHAWIQRGYHSTIIPFEGTSHDRRSGVAKAVAERSTPGKTIAGQSDKTLPRRSRRETTQDLYAALKRLPIEFREVLVLCDIEGWSYAQLASALDTSQAMVSNRLNQARRNLRHELAQSAGASDDR
jgi:RNA polymerase sigma-70 factor, ECF subfamily